MPPASLQAPDLIPDRALKGDDQDHFNHQQIAARLADLIRNGEPPLNIALFGPWGSGKSSVAGLLEKELQGSDDVRLVRYDAWKYGGEALKRNFIAHTAQELQLDERDPRYREFHRGLYESRRVAEVSTARLLTGMRRLGVRFAVLFTLFVALFATLAGCASLLTSEDFFGEIQRTLPSFLSGSATVALVVALVRTLFDIGTVQVEQSQVSEDERFSSTFRRLLAAAKEPVASGGRREQLDNWWHTAREDVLARLHWRELSVWWRGSQPSAPAPLTASRLVFFIDELDRCSRRDVVATLKAIRTFLDQTDSVFVVAADREVIERALIEAEQSTPLDEESPYFSTASAYLDKIFQHQVALPPLRVRRLTTYARQLVLERDGGLWRELATQDGGRPGATPALDAVLFVLIPSHVRSPRRVKVLLNNFAVNVRVAQSRIAGSWPARAQEIAKLTVLQTEFPQLAADLSQEPRLPRLLLSEGPAPSPSVQTLLARWNLRSDTSRDSDMLLLTRDDDDERHDEGAQGQEHPHREDRARVQELRRRRREELRRYLERTAHVDDIRRDLLYLQSAGDDVGLGDPELAELIERDSTDAPTAVLRALAQVGPEQRLAAAKLLASMVDEVLSVERRGVMTVLMELARQLGDTARTIDGELVGSLRAYRQSSELEPDQLLGALRIAALRSQDGDLLADLLRDERMWQSPQLVAELGSLGSKLPGGTLPRVRSAVAAQLASDPHVLTLPLERLSEVEGLELFEDDTIFEAIGAALEQSEADDEEL
ncbi:MAG TPA: P-loop NTPase fold protein [Conexibacter sp.]|nr:P-loop NTPase fold protein [Conexibacter sp.]